LWPGMWKVKHRTQPDAQKNCELFSPEPSAKNKADYI
jgi:hypothetical protein